MQNHPALRSRKRSLLFEFQAFLLAIAMLCGLQSAEGEQALDPAQLWTQATLYRDEWGVPHIQADNYAAMAFAFGYAQADDHVEAMLRAYRIANGRAAEVFGDEYAQSDEFSIKMGHAPMAQEALATADPITRDLCTAFALGVNAWIVEHPARTPTWADGARPEDVLALLHCYLMSFAPFDASTIYSRNPAAVTGNAWAIAPSRSTTGETILVINPHTDYRGPFQWCEAQLTCTDYNMIGATLFGLPIILQGHNGVLGWGFTPNMPDFADMYLQGPSSDNEKIGAQKPAVNPTALTVEILSHMKTFYVKTINGMDERQIPYMDTPLGPLIGNINGQLVTYLVGGYHDFGALRQIAEMGAAKDLDGFRAALQLHQIPCFHVLYADRAGNLFYLYNAKVGDKYWPKDTPPVENAAGDVVQTQPNADWTHPQPAGNSLYQWGAIATPDTLPTILNPPSGFLQACGNPPWLATTPSTLDPKKWPPWFVGDADTFRAERVRRLFSLGPRSFEDAQAMLYDVLDSFALVAVPKLLANADANKEWVDQAHPDLKTGLDVLRNWNYVAEVGSKGMTFFHLWWASCRSSAPKAWSDFYLRQALLTDDADIKQFALKAAEQAAKLMRSEFGSIEVPWGDVHKFVRGKESIGAPGALTGEPIFTASDLEFKDKLFPVNYGYAYAMAVKFGETVETASVVPFGSSDDPESPHYADQMKLMQERRLKFERFRTDDVQRFAKSAFGCAVRFVPPGIEASGIVRASKPVTVSSSIFTEAPVALPLGLATFTPYARVMADPVEEAITLEMSIYLPPELCAAEHLDRLAVYACDGRTWERLDGQELDTNTRLFTCRDHNRRAYAILGPQEFRAATQTDAKKRIAMSIPDSKIRQSAPGDEDAELPPPLTPADENAKPAQPKAEGPAPSTPVPSTEVPTTKAPPLESAPAPSAPPQGPSMQGPPTLMESNPTASKKTNAKESAIAWGTDIELKPPDVKGLVTVVAKKSVGVRLIVSLDAPRPVPEGLAAFTKYVAVDSPKNKEPLEITVRLRPEDGTCAPDSLNKLSLYAFDETAGWQKLADQKIDDKAHGLTGKDDAPRTYALLGPKAIQIRPPQVSQTPLGTVP